MTTSDQRPRATAFDALAAALAPALIIGMIGSLVFFLVIAFYRGDYDARLMYILGLYTIGIVLIARIAIESGRTHAAMFAAPLALAAALAMFRFVTLSGSLAGLSWLVNIGLLVLTWYLADRITYDCTLLEEDRESLQGGLLQTIGQSITEPSESPRPTKAAPIDSPPTATSKQLKKAKHNPGVWVLYFALIAFPLFGIGQLVIPDQRQRSLAFWMLVMYLGCALSLLMTTSLLGLRRYLRQRGTSMPTDITLRWLMTGGAMVLVVLLVALLLPLPGKTVSIAGIPIEFKSPDNLRPSQFGWGQEGTQPGEQPSGSNPSDPNRDGPAKSSNHQNENQSTDNKQSEAGNQSAANKQPRNNQPQNNQPNGSRPTNPQTNKNPSGNDQQSDKQSPASDQASNKPQASDQPNQRSSNQRSSNQRASQQPQSDARPPDPEQPRAAKDDRPHEDSPRDNAQRQDQSKDDQSKDDQSKDDQSKDDQSKDDQSKNEQSKNDQPDTDPAGTKPEPAPQKNPENAAQRAAEQPNEKPLRAGDGLSNASKNLASSLLQSLTGVTDWFKWILIFLLAAFVIFYALTHPAEMIRLWRDLVAFWHWLIGNNRSAATKTEQPNPQDAAPQRIPFANFINPFRENLKGWTPARVIEHTFVALEAWAEERGAPRKPAQTADEFARMLIAKLPQLEGLPQQAASMLDRMMFANWKPSINDLRPLEELWRILERSVMGGAG